jgi:ABC-type uncharacterized transport system involved in gliding motility auxiliary subunit
MQRPFHLILGVVLLIVAFFALNIVSTRVLRGARLDATDGRQFTLTSGSKSIARSPKDPVTLTLYYSAKQAQGNPSLQTYGARVRELLEEYARISGGKVILNVVDPVPDSESEDAAVAAGIPGFPLGNGQFYFGLVGTNLIDTKEVIPFFDPAQEAFLEYNVSRLISSLANPEKAVVAWISPLQLEGGYTMNPQTRQPSPLRQWQVLDEIKALYTVKRLDATVDAIPADVDVLIVAHPKGLEERTLFAIDQFVLRGGRLILFVDPLCESDQQEQFADASQKASSLGRLLGAWGVEVPEGQLAADQDIALRVMLGSRANPEQWPYVVWLEAGKDQLSAKDAVTGQVRKVTFASSGHVVAMGAMAEGSPRATIEPIITTTSRASTIPTASLGVQPDPKKLFNEFVPGGKALTLAARLSGTVRTAFPDGPPSNPDGQPIVSPDQQLKESTASIGVLLFADVDVLADAMWIREQNILGLRSVQKLADNGDMVVAAVDNFAGSTDLIQVRARQESARPFVKVEEIRKAAEQQYQKEEVRLQQKLEQTQQRMGELEKQKGADASGGLVLSPEQQAELQKFRAEMVQTRKDLRKVKLNLRQGIEDLGTKLKLINAGLVPLAVIVVALIIAFIRAQDRRMGVRAAAKQ